MAGASCTLPLSTPLLEHSYVDPTAENTRHGSRYQINQAIGAQPISNPVSKHTQQTAAVQQSRQNTQRDRLAGKQAGNLPSGRNPFYRGCLVTDKHTTPPTHTRAHTHTPARLVNGQPPGHCVFSVLPQPISSTTDAVAPTGCTGPVLGPVPHQTGHASTPSGRWPTESFNGHSMSSNGLCLAA